MGLHALDEATQIRTDEPLTHPSHTQDSLGLWVQRQPFGRTTALQIVDAPLPAHGDGKYRKNMQFSVQTKKRTKHYC
jgi:hypothetical protein